MDTLLLDENWDLTVSPAGDIAVAPSPYAIAQDVASAVRVFLGEQWYDISQGVPYFQQIMGRLPPIQFVKTALIAAGKTVPGVAGITCFLTGPGIAREVGGQLQITDSTGAISFVDTTNLQGIVPWYINAAVGGAFQA